MAELSLQTIGNRVTIAGGLRSKDFRRVLAAMYNLATNLGYSDIELDFSRCIEAYPAPMLAIAATAERYLTNHIDVDLTLPTESRLQRLFVNANWAHLIDPRRYEPSSYRGAAQIAATRYNSGQEQYERVQVVIDKILSHLSDFDRTHLRAIEWSLNEITDNVINHARSAIGGLLQVTNFHRRQRKVEFAVCDAGIGIPSSLRETHREIQSD